jgi:hypothetical protein
MTRRMLVLYIQLISAPRTSIVTGAQSVLCTTPLCLCWKRIPLETATHPANKERFK